MLRKFEFRKLALELAIRIGQIRDYASAVF